MCYSYFHIKGGLFTPHGLDLPISSKSGNCDLTKCDFKFLLILKPVIGTSGNTFLCPSSDARITCNSSKIFLTCRNTGWHVMLKVILLCFSWLLTLCKKIILLCFSWLLTFCKSASLGIALVQSFFLRTIFSL